MSTVLHFVLLVAVVVAVFLLASWAVRELNQLRAARNPEPDVEVEGSGLESHGPGSIASQHHWLDVDQDGPADDVAEEANEPLN